MLLAESKKNNTRGGHLVFQNEAKNIARQDFMVINPANVRSLAIIFFLLIGVMVTS